MGGRAPRCSYVKPRLGCNRRSCLVEASSARNRRTAILPENLLRDQPNERWQADVTHWQLADGTDVEMVSAGCGLQSHGAYVVNDLVVRVGEEHHRTAQASDSSQARCRMA